MELIFLIPHEIVQIIVAAVIGLLIGVERAWRNKVASIGTFSMISLGSCVLTLLSLSPEIGDNMPHDPTRIAAQIVTGVGFIGGGVIFKTSDRVEGITTAAMIWLTAALGMACGFNHISLALFALAIWSILTIIAMTLHKTIVDLRNKVKK